MAKLQIKAETLPIRCDICHQPDQFDPKINYCYRCAEIQQIENVNNLNTKEPSLPLAYRDLLIAILFGGISSSILMWLILIPILPLIFIPIGGAISTWLYFCRMRQTVNYKQGSLIGFLSGIVNVIMQALISAVTPHEGYIFSFLFFLSPLIGITAMSGSIIYVYFQKPLK